LIRHPDIPGKAGFEGAGVNHYLPSNGKFGGLTKIWNSGFILKKEKRH